MRRVLQTIALSLSALVLLGGQAGALSQEQQDVYNRGIYLFDTSVGGGCSAATVGPGTLPSLVPEPYNGAFTAAGKAYNVSPVLIAAIFTEEHFTGQSTSQIADSWKGLLKAQPDPNSGWATSPDNAMGPFQFIPTTWTNLGVDADKNGTNDVENLLDASYGAANYMKTDGATADTPKSVWVKFADGYSGHTGGYADQVSQYIDFYASGGTATSTSGTDNTVSTDGSGCAVGAVAGNIVQTALNFAWDDYGQPGGHTFTSKGAAEAKPAYVAAVKKYETDAGSDPSGYTTEYTDCGAFVATVMRASGVDPAYQQLTTGAQLTYVTGNSKYTVLGPGEWKPADAQPGDIFISDGHTYIYVGKHGAVSDYTVAQASQRGHVPEVNTLQPYTQQTIDGHTEYFSLVRFTQ